MCPFDYTVVAGSGKVWPVNQVNLTSRVAVVTPTYRPESVRNRRVIELFCNVVCVVTSPFWHFCWCRGFCHRIESDLILFLSSYIHNLHVKFESDWAKTVVCIVSTRSYTQSAKVDLDLWPRDPKSIGLLFSSSTTYMGSKKVIGQKL